MALICLQELLCIIPTSDKWAGSRYIGAGCLRVARAGDTPEVCAVPLDLKAYIPTRKNYVALLAASKKAQKPIRNS